LPYQRRGEVEVVVERLEDVVFLLGVEPGWVPLRAQITALPVPGASLEQNVIL
jgi:hypothetical protein